MKDLALPPAFPLRPPAQVMRLSRMGAAFPTRLSFLPTLLRRLHAEQARVTRPVWEIDAGGFGHAVYSVDLGGHTYSLVAVSSDLPADQRTDRVIAEAWDTAYVLYDGSEAGGPRILVTQGDVRAIQLAKSALYAGARLLMDQLEVETVDRVVLAGAFGAHISPKHAMVLGMIPDCPIDKVTSAGNAAGTGAMIALLNTEARSEVETAVRAIEKIETAIEPRFQEHFVNASAIPNSVDPFPILNELVHLPDVGFNTGASSEAGEGRRRRRRA